MKYPEQPVIKLNTQGSLVYITGQVIEARNSTEIECPFLAPQGFVENHKLIRYG
jgi:hypothetical protein